MSKLSGKVALVTGASEGIGYAVAKRFVEEGARVYITGRRLPQLEDAGRALGPAAVPLQGDAANLGDLDRIFAQIREGSGHIDVLVANAGIVAAQTIDVATPEHYDAIMSVNARGTFFTVQKALPLMSDGGSIVLMSSNMANKGFPGIGVYSATKAALRSFARTWTHELKDRGIRVNTLSPGAVLTPALRGQGGGTDEGLQHVVGMFSSLTPLGRIGRTEEIAAAALWLASGESSYSAGSDIVLDGGMSAV